jgi:PKD repeat protein
MHSSRETCMKLRFFTVIVTALGLGGCMMQNQSAPAEVGPSSFGAALTMTAVPDRLPRDGSSQATINLNFRDGMTNAPLTQRRIVLSTTAGTLSVGEVVTDASGNAAVTLTAPSLNTPVSSVAVSAAPLSGGSCVPQNGCTGNVDNSVVQFVRVGMLGPDVPIASFEFTPVPVTVGEPATFNATGTTLDGSACGGSCAYSWDFGDGTSGTGILIQHTFATTGVQTVTLTVAGPGGTTNSTSKSFVVSAPAPPVATFTVTPSAPTAGASAIFSAASSTVGVGVTIVQYTWDFGDGTGTTSVAPTVSKTYPGVGTFPVTLTITDSLGRTATVTQPVTVS